MHSTARDPACPTHRSARLPRSAKSYGDCCRKCQGNKKCKAFTWIEKKMSCQLSKNTTTKAQAGSWVGNPQGN